MMEQHMDMADENVFTASQNSPTGRNGGCDSCGDVQMNESTNPSSGNQCQNFLFPDLDFYVNHSVEDETTRKTTIISPAQTDATPGNRMMMIGFVTEQETEIIEKDLCSLNLRQDTETKDSSSTSIDVTTSSPNTTTTATRTTTIGTEAQIPKVSCVAWMNQNYQRCRWICLFIILFWMGFLVVILLWYKKDKAAGGGDYDDLLDSPWVWSSLQGNITVGAYYYPWYGHDFHHGSGYLRKLLDPLQTPVLGEYDDTDPAIILQHLKWSAQSNIRLWVTSWWGPGGTEDLTTRQIILSHPYLGDHQIALFYETTGRIKESENYTLHNVIPDLEYIAQNYFDHPNYYRIHDIPVLFVYLTRKLGSLGLLDHVVEMMRQAARNEGYNIFIVGDHVFQDPPDQAQVYPPFTILDAVTNYDVFGSMNRPSPYATEENLRDHFKKSLEWKRLAEKQKCVFIPAASPGYNDLGVRPDDQHGPLSRRLTAKDEPGSLFKRALQYSRKLVDPNADYLLMVNSFNEWHEDTQIEPTIVSKPTSLPLNITYGIEYEGYGELYLNILRAETREN